MSIPQQTSARNGARLNALYESYRQEPSASLQDALFAEIQNYAERVTTNLAKRESVPTDSVTDAVQETCLNVFQRLESFKSKSKFSTWVFTIVKNAFYDQLRQDSRQRNRPHIEGKHYGEYAGKFLNPRRGDDSDEVAETVFLLSQRELSAEEDKLNLQLDKQRLERSLSNEDYEILRGYLEGEKACETATRLRAKTKHVYNRRQVIKNRALQVRKSVPITRTISAKDAEGLAQGSRRAEEFAKVFCDLERERWTRLTVVLRWHSPFQVFSDEDFTVFGSFYGTASHLANNEGIVYFRGQGVFHPGYGYGVIDREQERTVTVRFRSSLQTVEKSSLRSADSCPAAKEYEVNAVGIRQSENVPDWVSKIVAFERLSIGEGLSLPI
jgi:RNA polymerase sigma factor (sigma-70 family)